MSHVLVDTGPLVALLNRRDRHHRWAREVFDTIEPPLGTCEAVLSETCFLLRRFPGGQDAVLALLEHRVIEPVFSMSAEIPALRALMARYASVPMSLADACLVRMSELDGDSVVVTLDRDFAIYRRNRRQRIPVIMPV